YSYNSAGDAVYAAESTVTTPANGDLPDPVDGLSVSISSGLVSLSWPARTDVANFDIVRSDDGGPWNVINTISGGASAYPDYSAGTEHAYTYRILARNDNLVSAPSNEVAATPGGLTAPPSVDATPDANGHVVLTW